MRTLNTTFKACLALTVSSVVSLASAEAGTRSYADITTTTYNASTTHITTPGEGLTELNFLMM